MPERDLLLDPNRPGLTLHEYLSTSPTVAAPLALASAPQASLVVTTLADLVDATDGVLSLREAVLEANATLGLDTISFADELRGGTIRLSGSPLIATDDLVIDGDPLDRGPGGIVIDGGSPQGTLERPFRAQGAGLRLEDLSIENVYDGAVFAKDGALDLQRIAIDGVFGGAGRGIWAEESEVLLIDSTISNGGYGSGLFMQDTATIVVNSTITDFLGDDVDGIGGSGTLVVIDSTISDLQGIFAAGIIVQGDVSIIGSTITGITGFDRGFAVALGADSNLEVINSTIAENIGSGIRTGADANALLVNSTITGNTGDGLLLGDGIDIGFFNSLILGNGFDIATTGGGTGSSTGSLWGTASIFPPPIPGLTADQVFAQTALVDGVLGGVLADNGGPTLTAALLDDAANPALDAADPDLAPLVDQRGFVRDAAPDIGAFELGAGPFALPPLPPLAEKVPLADADILGAPRGFLTLVAGDAAISFVDEFAAFQSSLGVYLVGPDGSIIDPQWVFERIEHAEPSDRASELARPGGGPLAPGETVWLSELFDPADLGPGVEFGLFLVTDGWAANPRAIFEVGSLAFRSGDAAAGVTDTTPQLFHIGEDGVERLVLGDIMHTVDAGSANPLSNTLNPGGTGQVTSGTLDGLFTVAFEDKPLAESDRDFNDAIVAIDLQDADDTIVAAATIPAGDADLATLLVTAETV